MRHDYTVLEYTCDTPACGRFTAREALGDQYSGEVYCPYCGNNEGVEPVYRPALWITVAAYETYRAYGGPEEGGWYYTTGTPIRGTAREFMECDYPVAEQYHDLLKLRYGEFTDVEVRVTTEAPAAPFPRNRPIYS